jgi:hypothetical protein
LSNLTWLVRSMAGLVNVLIVESLLSLAGI